MKQQAIQLPDPRETAQAARIALETAIKDAPVYGAKVGQQRMKNAVLSLVESGRVVERQAFTPRHPADKPLVWLELAVTP